MPELARRLLPSPAFRLRFVTLPSWRRVAPEARAAARAGAWAVAAVGGDGTFGMAASALAGSGCRLGLLPAGTANGLARSLGIPADLEAACAVLALGRSRRIDLLQGPDGRAAVHVAGAGFDAEVAAAANRLRPFLPPGLLRYLAAGLLCLPRLRGRRLRLELDGRRIEGRYLLVSVANSPQYGYGARLAPLAKLDDGRLELLCVEPGPPWRHLANLWRLFCGRPLAGALALGGRRLKLESLEGPLRVHLDGEPGGQTPLELAVRKRCLRVLVP